MLRASIYRSRWFFNCLGVLTGFLYLAVPGAEQAAFDPNQTAEHTCFQTSQPWHPRWNLRSDVAIVYGVDPGLPGRIQTWRDHGYRIHVMTGVSWGNYQDYLYGRFDGINHEDEAQTERDGKKISHGGDVYYMCPGTNFGKFLCVGVQRALDAGAEAIHLEEPEFWVRGGYSEGFKREWQSHYGEEWQAPHTSVDAQWRASKLKYFLYRRALQQVFDYVQDYNKRSSRKVRCYVPTHSLLNYAHWRIVSPESSLARLNGCDGYIAQVWTGTARTPNVYRGVLRERTFETAFLEYGAMQNLVRSTSRTVWYLNDPIEDNPNHDWEDYRQNWESTLVASLLQPDVWQYEVAPWPERVFPGKYPLKGKPQEREPIPQPYATELQVVMNALNHMNQKHVEWDCGTSGVGLLVSDSLMFQRGDPVPGDPHLSNVYGLALPFLKRGIPITPLQLENVTITNYLDGYDVLLLTYHGQKPLSSEVHAPIVSWVKAGGALVVVDDDSDPYNQVIDWWTLADKLKTPREHLFREMGGQVDDAEAGKVSKVGKGQVLWIRKNPSAIAQAEGGAAQLIGLIRPLARKSGSKWRETNYLLLRRGPYVVAAGLDECEPGRSRELKGEYVNLFDPMLRVRRSITVEPGTRWFLLDLKGARERRLPVFASGCKTVVLGQGPKELRLKVEGVADTEGILLAPAPAAPVSVELQGKPVKAVEYSEEEGLVWVRFSNEASARELVIRF